MVTNRTAESLALSVHGPVGVLDLVVPAGAVAADVAEEYARQAGLGVVPTLCTRLGALLAPDVALAHAGIETGDLLVATDAVVPAAGRRIDHAGTVQDHRGLGALVPVVAAVAAACAVLAGWSAGTSGSDRARILSVGVLLAGAVIGVLPVGRFSRHRVMAAPAFAVGATFALAWDPHPERLPMVIGVCGLAAALAAAVGRALGREADEELQVWIIGGAVVFGTTALLALIGGSPELAWSVLLLLAVLAARFVPGSAVDVPDQYLIDLERLAVTAWTARERAGGKRGRSVVPPAAIAEVASRGTRILTAATAAVLAVAAVAAPLLLSTATLSIDRIGARCLVGFAGGALLLAARSYRHAAPRALLRTAGLGCWAALGVDLLATMQDGGRWWLALAAVGLALTLVIVAVAVGRGWRSAWWSRRAEVAEGLCGAFALASLVVSAGWFRELWEFTSLWQLTS